MGGNHEKTKAGKERKRNGKGGKKNGTGAGPGNQYARKRNRHQERERKEKSGRGTGEKEGTPKGTETVLRIRLIVKRLMIRLYKKKITLIFPNCSS